MVDERPGMCFGFSVKEVAKDDIQVRLFFSGQEQDRDTQSIPSQLQDVWSEFDINADFDSFDKYTQQGYSILQNWVANSILRAETNLSSANLGVTIVPFKTDKYISD